MQPSWRQATPQMMQRHTGTPWQTGDNARPKKKPLPTPAKPSIQTAELREAALKSAGVRK